MLSWNYLHWKIIFHLLLVNVPLLYPWKEQKLNLSVFFKGYKKGTLESNELSSEKVFDWRWFRCYERNEGILKYWVTSGIFRMLAEIEVNWKLKNIFWIFVKAFYALIVTGLLCWILHIKYCYDSPVYIYPWNILVENVKIFFRTLK